MSETDEASKELLRCEDCGEQAGDVMATVCPYSQEVCGTTVPIVVCAKCYQSRADDI